MIIFLFLLHLISYAVYVFSIFKENNIKLGLKFGYFICMSISFGPHTTLFQSQMLNSYENVHENVPIMYSMIISFVFITLGVLQIFFISKTKINKTLFENINFSYIRIFVVLLILFVLISLILQPGLSITFQYLKYFAGSTSFTYEELRRDIFKDTLWAKSAALVRFTILPICYCYILLYILEKKEGIKKITFIFFLVFAVLVISMQLNKFYYLYYGVLSFLVYYSRKKRQILYLTRSKIIYYIPLIIIGIFIFTILIRLLYNLQYKEAINMNLVNYNDLQETMIYRIFFAVSDGLRLWIDYFTYVSDPEGLNVVSKLAFLTGKDYFDVNSYIPIYYFNNNQTTFQVGALGTAFSMFGFWSVPIFCIFIFCIIKLNVYIENLTENNGFYSLFSLQMFLNAFYLTSSELHTSLLSGGIISVPLFYLLLVKIKKQ